MLKNNQKNVAIVGKSNVGKSTFFNKLIGKRQSIVYDELQVTRDRLYQEVSWINQKWQLIDTGGISTFKQKEDNLFQDAIQEQVNIALDEATLILFFIDGRKELTYDDHYILGLLRKSNKKFFIVANKLENKQQMNNSLYSLGIENLFIISAMHGQGIGDLLDAINDYFVQIKLDKKLLANTFLKKIAIIGRENAGKSTLLNTFLNQNRAIVSDIPGTTRDAINAYVNFNEQNYEIIDTAGIKRKSKLKSSVSFFSLQRSFNALDRSDLSLIIIDANHELSNFDARVCGYAFEREKPVILVINKWDLIKKSPKTIEIFKKNIYKKFIFLTWAPIVFISAKTKQGIHKLIQTIDDVFKNINKKIKTSLLNEILVEIQTIRPAKSFNGGQLKIFFIKQVDAHIPKFIFFVNNKKFAHFSYLRHIQNKFREYFGFFGTPIKIVLRNKSEGS